MAGTMGKPAIKSNSSKGGKGESSSVICGTQGEREKGGGMRSAGERGGGGGNGKKNKVLFRMMDLARRPGRKKGSPR